MKRAILCATGLSAGLALPALLVLVLVAPPAHAHGILVTPRGGDQPVSARSPLSLRGHRVEATIEDRVAEVTVEQVFHNASEAQLEGTYLFPLPEGAAVSRFAMTMGDKMVEGEVIDADQARRVYEGIVRRRKDPGLLEYVGRGLFRARVFPIPAQGDVKVRLTFQQVLPADDGTLEFRYPLATTRFHRTPVQDVLVDVKVESQVDLKAVYSASHAVGIAREGERTARVTYESGRRRQERDFLLYLSRSPEDVGFSVLSHRPVGEAGTFMAVLAPRTEVRDDVVVPKDVVYVLDTSGSMAGKKIEQAKAALKYGIQVLRPEDRFNVIGFATGLHPFKDGFVDVSDESRAAATKWIDGLEATGGTNIEGALQRALQLKSGERLFLVVFLTDGEPTVGERDPNKLVKKVRLANVSQARIFTFGVGHDLDVKLLDRIAEATRGTRDYVMPEEDLEIVTSRFFRKVNRPVLSHLEIELGDGVHDVYPQELSDLFAGEQVVLFGRYREPGKRTWKLTGRIGVREVVYVHGAELRAGEGAGFLPRLWAHRKVAFLLDQMRLHGRDEELVKEVKALATRFAIVTPFTAGLVVEEHEMRGEPVIRDGAVADHVETDNDLPFEESIGEDGISDAPFSGPAHNGLIGLGGGSGGAFGRQGGRRSRGRRTHAAVADNFAWLAAHQAPDGGWPADTFARWCDGKPQDPAGTDGAGEARRTVGTTGLALASFLGAGYTNRGRHAYAKNVSKGLRFLKNVQDAEGCFGPRDHDDFLVDHAAAALAMSEAYGITGSPIFKGSAEKGIAFLLLARNADGGWGRYVRQEPSDVHATGAVMLALQSAIRIDRDLEVRGKAPVFRVPAQVTDALQRYFLNLTDPATGRVRPQAGVEATTDDWLPTAYGLLARAFAGVDVRQDATARRQATALLECLPHWDPNDATLDLRAWWVGTLAMFQAGGPSWKTWNEALKIAVIDQQRKDTTYCRLRGSWDPIGRGMASGGRVMSTSLMSLCLQVYYRYDRVFGARAPVADPQRVQATPQLDETKTSETLRDLKGDHAAAGGDRGDGLDGVRARIRRVAGKTFTRRGDGVWLDTAWDPESDVTEVEAYTDAYFALLAKGKHVARILAVAERMIFVLDGQAYEIVPAEKAAPQEESE